MKRSYNGVLNNGRDGCEKGVSPEQSNEELITPLGINMSIQSIIDNHADDPYGTFHLRFFLIFKVCQYKLGHKVFF